MEELVKKIKEIYFKYGIKSVTMDDLARELCISKKTLYQYFNDKDDVVRKVLEHHFASQDCDIKKLIPKEGNNAIDNLLLISKYIAEHLQKMNPALTYDLQKYHSEIWKNSVEKSRIHILERIKKNMHIGIQQNLYRSDFNIDIIAGFYMQRIEINMQNNFEMFNQYPFDEVFNNLFIYHIRGIANRNGIEYLEKKLKSITQTKN